ncbi:putative transmembrane protein [Candidatus Rhodobacter oscarellae]|uniref:Putative transmembrane protein n=1 Tax=Candidatus Rhodobacter oscarellae TaxID=1675527 RepID=A0A0J9EC52_9RHOB|nr:DMT family transporter [Candidatus Rhodobacter lobularis]KMW60206.1 putative transmembrane protein [Candidatus Rhodobacter lobularis]
MEAWIPITIMAALAQTVRFMAQKQLKTAGLSTGGATFARFVYSAPLVAVLILIYANASGQPLPGVNGRFWAYAMSGGLAQILATMCVVAIFAHRNFAVGITFKKTEVVMTAIASFLILGEGVGLWGGVAIAIGLVGVLVLSDPPGGEGAWSARIFNRSAGLGIASGVFFAISAVGYRGASLSLEGGDTALRAGVTLAIVTASQTLAMAIWLAWRERGQIMAVLRAWRVAAVVGVMSMIGSFCWFTAFTLQNVAYVNALGQVELIFSIAASALFFREKITSREYTGIAVLTAGILVLVLLG